MKKLNFRCYLIVQTFSESLRPTCPGLLRPTTRRLPYSVPSYDNKKYANSAIGIKFDVSIFLCFMFMFLKQNLNVYSFNTQNKITCIPEIKLLNFKGIFFTDKYNMVMRPVSYLLFSQLFDYYLC